VPVVARRLEELRSTSSHNRDADLIREACNDRATTVPSKGEESAPLRTRYDVLLDLGLSAGLRRRRWDCRGHRDCRAREMNSSAGAATSLVFTSSVLP
jgi:hypothetical protein